MHSLRIRMSSIMRRRSGEIFSGESFMVLLRLRYEAECLTSQHTKQNPRDQPPTYTDRSYPYRASGLVPRPYPVGRQGRLRGKPNVSGLERILTLESRTSA